MYVPIHERLPLFSTHNDRLVSSAQHPNEAMQTTKFPGLDQGSAHLLLYTGRPRAPIQRNYSVSITEQMVIEMSWKALKREQHMLRNNRGCNRRIYSPEQPRVSDRIVALLSPLLQLNSEADASHLTHSSCFPHNHQPRSLSTYSGRDLRLQLRTLSIL